MSSLEETKSKGVLMPKGLAATVIHSKYKSYCSRCHYSIWVNEKIGFDGKAHHLNCIRAIQDGTPRVLDERYVRMLGQVDKRRLRKALDHRQAGGQDASVLQNEE